jgi:hypothetical protein
MMTHGPQRITITDLLAHRKPAGPSAQRVGDLDLGRLRAQLPVEAA